MFHRLTTIHAVKNIRNNRRSVWVLPRKGNEKLIGTRTVAPSYIPLRLSLPQSSILRIPRSFVSTTVTKYGKDTKKEETSVMDEDTPEEDLEEGGATTSEKKKSILELTEMDVCVCSPYVSTLAMYAEAEATVVKEDKLYPEDWTEEEKEYTDEILYDTEEDVDGVPLGFSLGAQLQLIYQNRPLELRTMKEIYTDTGIVIPSSKDCLSSTLRTDLLTAVNDYITKPTTPVDYHPGSDNKVRDIIHPSLYPYVHGLSIISQGEETGPKGTVKGTTSSIFDAFAYNFDTGKENEPPKDPDDTFRYADDLDHFGRTINYSSTYQWLPSEFFIDEHGKVSINSYINNLPTEETRLYALIGQAFEHVVPYLELAWSHGKQMIYNGVRNVFSDGGGLETFQTGISALRKRNVQVITKIVRITLDPPAPYRIGEKQESDNRHRLEGAWHAEGMSNEFIVATGSITLQSSLETTLKFRRNYTEDEAGTLVTEMGQDPPGYIRNFLESKLVPLGKMEIKEGDIVVFPNSHIHKLDMSHTYSSKEKGERTILVFWLIDPDRRILSTKHIKEQQKYNPAFTWEKALEHRLALMKERSKVKQQYQQAELNLCEH